jgi:O-antigen ligase
MSSSSRESLARFEPWIPSALLAAVWFGSAFVSPTAGAMAGLWAASVALVPLGIWAALRGRLPGDRSLMVLGAGTLCAAWAIVSAAASTTPNVGLIGAVGQHSGAALWVVALGWFAVCLFAGGPTSLRRTTQTAAALGTATAVWLLLDAARVIPAGLRYSPEAAGLFESSISAGGLLALTIGCAAAAALLARRSESKAAWWLAAGIQAAALVVSGARGALAGVVVSAVVATAWILASRHRRPLVVWAASIGVLVAGAAALVVPAVLQGGDVATTLLSGRPIIWKSAVLKALAHPVTGTGPDQFSTILVWQPLSGAGIQIQGAYDPHNLFLYWLTETGVVGLALTVITIGLAIWVLWRAVRRSGPAAAVIAIAAALAAFAFSELTAWFHPLSLIIATALGGCAFAAFDPRSADERPEAVLAVRLAAGALAVVGAAAAVGMAQPAALELQWAAAQTAQAASETPAVILTAPARWRDPVYAATAAASLIASTGPQPTVAGRWNGAVALMKGYRPETRWHVDLTLTDIEVVQTQELQTGRDMTAAFEEAVARGYVADPSTALWDYVAATWFDSRDRAELAKRYAARALAKDGLTPEARAQMKAFAEGR